MSPEFLTEMLDDPDIGAFKSAGDEVFYSGQFALFGKLFRRQSVAYRFQYRSADRTLKAEEVDAAYRERHRPAPHIARLRLDRLPPGDGHPESVSRMLSAGRPDLPKPKSAPDHESVFTPNSQFMNCKLAASILLSDVMHRKILLPLILLGLSSSSQALTEDGKKAAAELIAAIKEEMKVLDEAAPDNNRSHSARYFIRQFESALAKGNDNNIEQALESSDASFKSVKAITSLARLKEAIKAGRDQQAQATIDQLEALIKTTTEKVLAARSPAELDDIIEELSRKQSSEYDEGRNYDTAKQKTIRQLTIRLSNAKQFVTGWQNYLQAKKSGNAYQTIQVLRSLSVNESCFIPRSQLLDRIEQEKATSEDPSKIVEGIETLDDMRGALKALAAAQQIARYSDQPSQAANDLVPLIGRLEKTYREFLAGLPVNIEIFSQSYDSSSPSSGASIIARLRADLLKLVLPRYLDLPEGTAAKSGESIQKFIDRLLAESKERADAAASRRIIELKQSYFRSSRFTTTDTACLQDYSAGQNQIAAGQYFLAVVSLQRALSRGSDLLPVKQIGEQLAAIKKDHPKEYEEGMTEFLTPRPGRDYPFGGMSFRGYPDPRMRDSDQDPRQQAGPSVLLPVPAREAAAAPPKAEDAKPAGEKPKAPETPAPRETPPPAH